MDEAREGENGHGNGSGARNASEKSREAALSVQARGQARLWSDEARLWQAVLENGPHPVAYGALGKVHGERGEYARAVESFDRALALVAATHPELDGPIYDLNRAAYALAAAGAAGDPATRDEFLAAAADSATRGSERWPDIENFNHYLGRVRRARGKASPAERAF